MHVLVVQDDKPVARLVKQGLESDQYRVDVVCDGRQVESLIDHANFDLVILDLVLPKLAGYQVLNHIGTQRPYVPVLALSGGAGVEDRVKALDMGADDYLAKPFAFKELATRVQALLRRSPLSLGFTRRVEDLELDRVGRMVRRGGPHRLDPSRIRVARLPHAQCGTVCDTGYDHQVCLGFSLRHGDEYRGRLHHVFAQ